ncbi:hypothetical protein MKX03_013871 [Papaver bracteatum]|nr:hypothetical protein MKX03_013871 [Papaver bracteatum]
MRDVRLAWPRREFHQLYQMLHWILSRLKATIRFMALGQSRRLLEKKVVTELSKMLVREEIAENSTVYFDASIDGNELAYRVEKNGGLVNASTGEKFDILIGVKNDVASQAVKRMKIMELDEDEEMED